MRILADSMRLAQPTAPRVHARVRSGVHISIYISDADGSPGRRIAALHRLTAPVRPDPSTEREALGKRKCLGVHCTPVHSSEEVVVSSQRAQTTQCVSGSQVLGLGTHAATALGLAAAGTRAVAPCPEIERPYMKSINESQEAHWRANCELEAPYSGRVGHSRAAACLVRHRTEPLFARQFQEPFWLNQGVPETGGFLLGGQ
jgi:hypothetical protein